MAITYEFDVKMACGGCAAVVKKVVTSLPLVISVETSVDKQKVSVDVQGGLLYDDVKSTIIGTGKSVSGGRRIVDNHVEEMA